MSVLLSLLFTSSITFAQDAEYRMNDVGGTVVLPSGWEVMEQGWSDWMFKATSRDNLMMKLWLTPYQPELNQASAEAWGEMYTRHLEAEGLKEVSVVFSKVGELAGHQVVLTRLDFSLRGEQDMVAHIAAFNSAGQTVHVRVLGLERKLSRIEAGLESIVSHLQMDSGPLAAQAAVSTEAGFSVQLPEGWRAPHPKELVEVRKLTGPLGQEELTPETCLVGLRPHADADPDVLFACGTRMQVGRIDEYSFSGVEEDVRDRFFGSSQTPVEKGVSINVGDRMGVLYRPPIAGGNYRMSLAPYDQGMMMTWVFGANITDEILDKDVSAVLASTQFTGPDGGHPTMAATDWVAYYLSYRPFSAPVIFSALGLAGLIGLAVGYIRRRRPSYLLDDLATEECSV